METASVGKRTKIDLNNYLSFPCNQIFEFEVRNLNIICIPCNKILSISLLQSSQPMRFELLLIIDVYVDIILNCNFVRVNK